ncbi:MULTISPECIES: type II toxin-antitoxin system RelE/ParE family toxin [Capnocytophaga]|mgnify:FL=1|jgi:hypothetical protein|uniref:Plasmid stabilization system protein ParE n=1 Tax=Capnocytophaga granulosa TaxID=45242 RepID=A0A1H2YZZ3_9FLAO|nr:MULTISPECIES: type II toxin-antitoxin system RelE/ParE family toxin [Capnocytophaga]EJU30725.1 plasmid stabilization system protein, RelE/ParE family [Capnocytophaga sp. CM59]EPD27394.1 hypothetical protein HMPREF9331_02334 [Capnocytophaga granulosa ATCC 51502]SDX10635.1 Plasmid stabilization system protein ParE [Capnocytophaga granulosa]SUX14862.1 Uncharacterised protein [Capnocytophaga granulosa]SUX93653.1 Uncharacterised protein [Capnocytophaga granulosa]
MGKKVKVTWSAVAKIQYYDTLIFWNEHNQSNEYSKKIRAKIKEASSKLSSFPKIGKERPEDREVRQIIVLSHFSLFYRIYEINEDLTEIVIVTFWDNRNDPNKLKF